MFYFRFCEDDVANISKDDKAEELKKVTDSAASTSVEKKTVPQCLICMVNVINKY